MFQKQKETILSLERAMYDSKSYTNNYLIPYMDFLDSTDAFTDFNCEIFEGKEKYLTLINQLLMTDETSKVFVEIYGIEDDNDHASISADTLIIFTALSLSDIEEIFYKPTDIFPSDIGELIDFDKTYICIDKYGNQIPATTYINENFYVYFCWWD